MGLKFLSEMGSLLFIIMSGLDLGAYSNLVGTV
jgi:hypothetical protein